MSTHAPPIARAQRFSIEALFVLPPALVWPLIADTNRLNLLAGMGPVRYETQTLPNGESRRFGLGKLAGLAVRWEERPFAWQYPEHLAVERHFDNGPLKAYRSKVVLQPDGAGTRLIHTIELVPRGPIWGTLVALGTGAQKAGWERAYAAVGAYLADKGPYPFAPTDGPIGHPLASYADKLQGAGHPAWRVKKLLLLVATGSDLEVQQIRPFQLADRWVDDRQAVLGLCLTAAQIGLLEPRWSHLCPRCRGPKGSVATLAQLAGEARCSDCGITFSGQFDQSIELAFRPARALREVSEVVYCVAGPGTTPHIVYQGRLEAVADTVIELALEPGSYALRGPWQANEAAFVFMGPELPANTLEVDLTAPDPYEALGLTEVGGPTLVLSLRNPGPVALNVTLERSSWSDQAVTAAYASTLAIFRETLGSEALAPAACVPVSLLAFLALRAAGSAQVYVELGAEAGHHHVSNWLASLMPAIAAGGGVLYKQAGDVWLAAFFDPLAAAETALTVLSVLQEDTAESHLTLALGADAGSCVAVGPGIDYAGLPIQGAIEACRLAQGGELLLGTALARDTSVQMLLGGSADWLTDAWPSDENPSGLRVSPATRGF